jgi:hypothetical protein
MTVYVLVSGDYDEGGDTIERVFSDLQMAMDTGDALALQRGFGASREGRIWIDNAGGSYSYNIRGGSLFLAIERHEVKE